MDAVDARQVRLTIDHCTLHRISAHSTYTTLTSSRVISGGLSISSTSSFTDNVFKGNGRDPSGVTDDAGHAVRGAIHIGRAVSPITLTGNVGKRNAGYFVWVSPPSGVMDGGGNRGRPCGPQPLPLVCR